MPGKNVAVSLLVGVNVQAVMNDGGVPYDLSNRAPKSQGVYSTDFEKNVYGQVDHFDVYGEVQTKYSQVYWTRNGNIPLPEDLVAKFKGKVMAITGYEVDQVTHTGPEAELAGQRNEDGQLTGFSCYPDCGQDKSVPIYHAYNHHYFGWLANDDAQAYTLGKETWLPNPSKTAFRTTPHNYSYPSEIVFKENPGGEFRKSYHGYPSGFAQLLYSPTYGIIEPMQIDTHNRNFSITDTEGYTQDFLPRSQSNRSQTELDNQLSPLIECPCSTRIRRLLVNTSAVLNEGTCASPIVDLQACLQEAYSFVTVASSATIHNTSQPSGCLLLPTAPTAQGAPRFDVAFNEVPANASATCSFGSSATGDKTLYATKALAGLVNASIQTDGSTVSLTLSGPDGSWFGVGFDAQAMSDAPYAVIVDGEGEVTERRLAMHDPGRLLPPLLKLVSSTAYAGIRTIVATRPQQGPSSDYFAFPTQAGALNVIAAIGSTPELSYHKARGPDSLVFVASKTPSCLCQPEQSPFIDYMNSSLLAYNTVCADEPRGDMLRHGDGTGRDLPNNACSVMTYHGGLRCCQNSWFLTDAEQAPMIPDVVDTFYFQEYVPPSIAPVTPASHRHLHHWVFLIDAQVNDYEEDNAHYGDTSVGKITAHLRGKDIGLEDTPSSYSKITFHVMTPHCHAPSCISEELWNADTGELLCNVTAVYGSEEYGPTSLPFNEAAYVTLNPCIWGSQPGLRSPPSITADTNLTAIKYFNNTFRHLGQMAQWTGLMTYDTDPF